MKEIQRRFCFYLLICLFLLTSSSIVSAQTSPLNLKIVGVDNSAFPLMKVFLSVFDAQGLSISGLDGSVFTVSEENRPVSDIAITPFVNKDQPLAFVLVLDTSGSMAGKPLSDSVAAANNFISALTPNDRVAIIAFSTYSSVIQELTSDHDKLINALAGLKTEGDTALYDAIVDATVILKNRSERKVIVLLTDGKESGISKFKFDEVVIEFIKWASPIYPIGFGAVDKNELDRLAILTGGFAQFDPDSSALTDAFQNVLDNLREQYLVEFPSSLQADGLEHELNININFQNGSAATTAKFIAQPGHVSLTIPDMPDGTEISGQVLFKPQILAPAPISRLDISIDGQPFASVLVKPFEYAWESTAISPGDHLFEFSVSDSAGNTGSLAVPLTVIPPVSVTTELTPDQIISGKTMISADVLAPAGVANVEFFVDNQLLTELFSAPYEVEWDTVRVSPGYHDIRIEATDVNGYSDEIQFQVNVDIQNSTNLIWVALIVILAAIAIILPLAMRRNKQRKKGITPPVEEENISPAQQNNSGAILIENEGANPGQIWPLDKAEVRLGRRKATNDIPLLGLKASRDHAIISLQPDGYCIRPINLDNPILINGIPIEEEVILKDGDQIEAGESSFIFELQD